MNPQTIAIFAGGLRAVLAASIGLVVAKYVPNPILAPLLALIAVAFVCIWSIIQKKDTEQDVFPIIMGAVRNFAAALIMYALSRGWLTSEQAKEITAAGVLLLVMLSSAEQKKLTVGK